MRRLSSRFWLIYFVWLSLLLVACAEPNSSVTSVEPTPTTTPAQPTAQPLMTSASLAPAVTGVALTPQEQIMITTPTPPATLDPTMIARLPKFNGLPVLPLFNSKSAIRQPTSERRANYGTDGKPKVGLQAGHWRVENHPDELADFRKNTGAVAGGLREVDLNLATAQRVATLLEAQGVEVEILPATPPINYQADLFLALHADGDPTGREHGFKLASSRYSLLPATDDGLVADLYRSYGAATGMPRDDNHITPNMLGYFAFNNRRYQHAINPLTPAAILEMGYVTSEGDRRIFRERERAVAQGIADGIMEFLKNRPALEKRESLVAWLLIETTADHAPIFERPNGPVIGYLSKGQRFDWFDSKDTYYLVDVPLLRQGLFVKKSDFLTISVPKQP